MKASDPATPLKVLPFSAHGARVAMNDGNNDPSMAHCLACVRAINCSVNNTALNIHLFLAAAVDVLVT